MIIFNNKEMPTQYVQIETVGRGKKRPIDDFIIEIRSRETDPRVILQKLKDNENLSEILSISAYKTGEGRFETQDHFHPNDDASEEHIYLSDDVLENMEEEEREKDREEIFQAYEAFTFNHPWRTYPFEQVEVTIEQVIEQLSSALGIMPTLKDIPNKTVDELQRLSAIGDRLYWGFQDITMSNHLPSIRDIEFYQSLNDYEKRIINTSGVHPLEMLHLAEYLKAKDPGRLLTVDLENKMHGMTGIFLGFLGENVTGITSESLAKRVAELEKQPGAWIYISDNLVHSKDIPFIVDSCIEANKKKWNNRYTDLSHKFEKTLIEKRSGTVARTGQILSQFGYQTDEDNRRIPMLSSIYQIYNRALSAIESGELDYSKVALNHWKQELLEEDFAMAMLNNRAFIDEETMRAVYSYNNYNSDGYQRTLLSLADKYKDLFTNEFIPTHPNGYVTQDINEYAQTKYVQPVSRIIKKAEDISRELYHGFVPRVLAEYVYAHLMLDNFEPTEARIREIVSGFDRTSVSKIAKYKSAVLFALSDKLNFAEVKVEHAEIMATYIKKNSLRRLLDKGFVEWYKANKNVNTSDLVELLEKQEIIPEFTKSKSALELIDDVVNARGKQECRLMESKYHYSFADNELAIRGRHVVVQDGKLKMYMLQANDYRNFTIGYDTHCCQHYGNAGESCVWKLTSDPFAGAVVIERDGTILGQAFIWTDESKDTLVFDNMEFANDRQVSSYMSLIAAWCEAMPYKNIHMGMGYNAIGNGIGKPVTEEMEATLPTTTGRNPLRSDYCDDGVDIYTDYHVTRSYGNKARALKNNGQTFIASKPNIRVTVREDEPTRWDVLAKPETSIWLNDFRTPIEERLAFANEFLTNPSPEVQMKAVKKNPYAIKYIEHPTEAVQEYVVQNNPKDAIYIQNPCEHVQEILLDLDANYIRKMSQITPAMAKKAVSVNGLLLEAVPAESRTEDVIRTAVEQNGYAIKFVQRTNNGQIPESILELAIHSNPKVITMIPYASENIKKAAVALNPEIIGLMDNPSPTIQLAAVNNDPYAINRIKNPSFEAVKKAIEKNGLLIRNYQHLYPELRITAVRQNGFALRALHDPTDEEMVAAVQQNHAAQSLIKDPEKLANVMAVLDHTEIEEPDIE